MTAYFLQSELALGTFVAPSPGCAGEVVSYRATFALTTGNETAGTIIEMGPLPAGCELDDVILDSDQLDSNGSPTVTLSVGLLTGNYGALLDNSGDARALTGDAVITASTIGQAGTTLERPTAKTAVRNTTLSTDQGIGVEIVAAPATAVAGTIGLTVKYRGTLGMQ